MSIFLINYLNIFDNNNVTINTVLCSYNNNKNDNHNLLLLIRVLIIITIILTLFNIYFINNKLLLLWLL